MEILMQKLETAPLKGFEGPTCGHAESRMVAFLHTTAKRKTQFVSQITVALRGLPESSQPITALQKSLDFGEPTYLCLTGEYAGCLAAQPNRKKNTALTPQPVIQLADAYIKRPLLATTQTVDLLYSFILKPYMDNDTLDVYSATMELLTTMDVPYDYARFEENILTFTECL